MPVAARTTKRAVIYLFTIIFISFIYVTFKSLFGASSLRFGLEKCLYLSFLSLFINCFCIASLLLLRSSRVDLIAYLISKENAKVLIPSA